MRCVKGGRREGDVQVNVKRKSERHVTAEALACIHKPCGGIVAVGVFRDGEMSREISREVTGGMTADDQLRVMTTAAVRRGKWCECSS